MEAFVLLVLAVLLAKTSGSLPDCRRNEGDTPMSPLDIVGLVLALGLGVYLVVALLLPEKFE